MDKSTTSLFSPKTLPSREEIDSSVNDCRLVTISVSTKFDIFCVIESIVSLIFAVVCFNALSAITSTIVETSRESNTSVSSEEDSVVVDDTSVVSAAIKDVVLAVSDSSAAIKDVVLAVSDSSEAVNEETLDNSDSSEAVNEETLDNSDSSEAVNSVVVSESVVSFIAAAADSTVSMVSTSFAASVRESSSEISLVSND